MGEPAEAPEEAAGGYAGDFGISRSRVRLATALLTMQYQSVGALTGVLDRGRGEIFIKTVKRHSLVRTNSEVWGDQWWSRRKVFPFQDEGLFLC